MSFTSHAAARPTTVINRLGLQAMRNVDLHRSDLPVYTPSSNKSSTAYSGRYDIYSTNYIYNQLSSAERKFWDGLDAVCYKLLSTKADAYTVNTYDSETSNASTEFVKYTGLSSSRATDIMYYFKYSNPQYYFLDILTWTGNGTKAFSVYDEFADGLDRYKATTEFTSAADSILAAASAYSTDEEKIRYFQQAIVDRTTYDHEANDTNFKSYDNPFHQSAYSVFCDDHSVCAGYSMAMTYLCNGAGIDCVSVTSVDHQWNQVRLDDNWYNIDVTWADTDDSSYGVYYGYYLKSDSTYRSDRGNSESHTPEDIWYGYLRSCVLDSSASDYTAGGIPTVYDEASTPLIIGSDSSYIITCDTYGSRIYYTTDGSTPSEASSKSYIYSGSINVTNPSGLRAIAVADGRRQSSTAAYASPTDTSTEGIAPSDISSGDSSDSSGITLTAPAIKKLVNRKTRKLVIKFSGLGQGQGYQIAYSTKKTSVGTKRKAGSTSTYTVRNLTKGKTYYIRVRTYAKVDGTNVYSKWSTVKKIKITK